MSEVDESQKVAKTTDAAPIKKGLRKPKSLDHTESYGKTVGGLLKLKGVNMKGSK
jgi:hypothetical protein